MLAEGMRLSTRLPVPALAVLALGCGGTLREDHGSDGSAPNSAGDSAGAGDSTLGSPEAGLLDDGAMEAASDVASRGDTAATGTDAIADVNIAMPSECGAPDASDGEAETSSGACGTGTVTFRLYRGHGGPWLVSISGDEEPNWLALFTASGTPLYLNPAEWASQDCDCSGGPALPIGFGGFDLGDAGAAQVWDGHYFTIGQFPDASCTSFGGQYEVGSCLVPGCAPPGQYVAYMCACGAGDASPSSGVPSSYAYAVADCANPTCVRVPFDYPCQTVVVGTVE